MGSSLLLLNSCRKDRFETYDNTKNGSAFFPIKEDLYHVYKVDRIIYDAFNNRTDTSHFIIKIHQDTFFYDNLERKAMRFVQYTRDIRHNAWDTIRSYYYVGLNTHIESVIENQRNVILTLPIIEESVWDFNTYNTFPQYLLTYSQHLDSYQNDSIKAGESIEVMRLGRNLPFEENYWREIYSSGIGLVSREYTNIEIIDNRLSGIKEKKELIQYGIEK